MHFVVTRLLRAHTDSGAEFVGEAINKIVASFIIPVLAICVRRSGSGPNDLIMKCRGSSLPERGRILSLGEINRIYLCEEIMFNVVIINFKFRLTYDL